MDFKLSTVTNLVLHDMTAVRNITNNNINENNNNININERNDIIIFYVETTRNLTKYQ